MAGAFTADRDLARDRVHHLPNQAAGPLTAVLHRGGDVARGGAEGDGGFVEVADRPTDPVTTLDIAGGVGVRDLRILGEPDQTSDPIAGRLDGHVRVRVRDAPAPHLADQAAEIIRAVVGGLPRDVADAPRGGDVHQARPPPFVTFDGLPDGAPDVSVGPRDVHGGVGMPNHALDCLPHKAADVSGACDGPLHRDVADGRTVGFADDASDLSCRPNRTLKAGMLEGDALVDGTGDAADIAPAAIEVGRRGRHVDHRVADGDVFKGDPVVGAPDGATHTAVGHVGAVGHADGSADRQVAEDGPVLGAADETAEVPCSCFVIGSTAAHIYGEGEVTDRRVLDQAAARCADQRAGVVVVRAVKELGVADAHHGRLEVYVAHGCPQSVGDETRRFPVGVDGEVKPADGVASAIEGAAERDDGRVGPA